MNFSYSTRTSEVSLFPKVYIVLINQNGHFCEQLTNMFHFSAFFLWQPVLKITITCTEGHGHIRDFPVSGQILILTYPHLQCRAAVALKNIQVALLTSTRNISIMVLCFENTTYIISLNLSMCRDVGITIFVLGIKKLRPALDHLAPAFPFSIISYIPYISVRLTGAILLKI